MIYIIDLRPGGFPKSVRPSSQSDRSESPHQLANEAFTKLPQEIPLETATPLHTAESVQRRHAQTTIQDTTIRTKIVEMTSTLDGSAGAGNYHLCQVYLTGPVGATQSFSILNPKTWGKTGTREIQLELQIGTEACPNWDHANLCLSAIRDLVMQQGGYLDDAVVMALTTHLGAKVATSQGIQAN